jgi:hypothetical protein
MKYYIKHPYASQAMLITTIKGEVVNLLGKNISQDIEETPNRPARKFFARGVTQKELEYLHEEDPGNYTRLIGKRSEQELKALKEDAVEAKILKEGAK